MTKIKNYRRVEDGVTGAIAPITVRFDQRQVSELMKLRREIEGVLIGVDPGIADDSAYMKSLILINTILMDMDDNIGKAEWAGLEITKARLAADVTDKTESKHLLTVYEGIFAPRTKDGYCCPVGSGSYWLTVPEYALKEPKTGEDSDWISIVHVIAPGDINLDDSENAHIVNDLTRSVKSLMKQMSNDGELVHSGRITALDGYKLLSVLPDDLIKDDAWCIVMSLNKNL